MLKAILILESDLDVLEMIKMILSEEGHVVITSPVCPPADEIGRLLPDLILIDDRLTVGSGRELCKKLKEDPFTAGISIIVLSSNPNLGQLTLENYADGFLNKPFDINDLIGLARMETRR